MIAVEVRIEDGASPTLTAVQRGLSDLTVLNQHVAAAAESTTREHLREIDPNMHTTRARLGVSLGNPPSYWASRIAAVESRATKDAAIVSMGKDSEIFERTFGPVVVRPVSAKHLTIPANAATFGRRAREFSGMFPVTFKSGKKALAQREGKGLKVMYWLKDEVTLPEERRLLPSDEQFLNAAEQGARDFVNTLAGGES